MSGLRLTSADLLAFARGSGDHNPLHVDPVFAHRSVFGRPVAHGALAAAVTLALTARPGELDALAELTVDFDQPVLPGITYTAARGAGDSAELRLGPARVLSLRWRAPDGHGEPVPWTEAGPAEGAQGADGTHRVRGAHGFHGTHGGGSPMAPRARALDATTLAALPEETGEWAPDLPLLRDLSHRLTGTAPPARVLGALAWASWFTGMRTPGRDALLVGVRLHTGAETPGTPATSWRHHVRVPELHPRSGLVTCTATLTAPGARSRTGLTVSSLLRHRIADPEPAGTAALLPPSEALRGHTVAVVGGSKGLGAALSYCLARQGARVLAVSSTPAPELGARAAASGLDVEPVVCDARDPEALRSAVAGRATDGLVLAASPRVVGLPVDPAAVDASVEHIADAARMALAPVAAVRDSLRTGAFLVFVSSTAAVDSSPHWPHYAAGKAAVEGLARHLAQHEPGLRVLVARPPRMWTEMANGPAGRGGAASPDDVAAGIVARLLTPRPEAPRPATSHPEIPHPETPQPETPWPGGSGTRLAPEQPELLAPEALFAAPSDVQVRAQSGHTPR